MNPTTTPASRPHLLGLLAGLFLAAGLVLSAMVFTRAWLKISESEAITVTGSARRNVDADLIAWRGSFATEQPTLLEAQRRLAEDRRKVEGFLAQHGFTNASFNSIAITELQARQVQNEGGEETARQKTVGYRLTQALEIRSGNIDGVLAMDRSTVALLEAGVVFTALSPDFIYTQAGEAKIEMLAEATQDAKARAGQIAGQGDRRIARLRSARMGVFQITPLYSTQASWDGMNDTTSRQKTVTAVVNAAFLLD